MHDFLQDARAAQVEPRKVRAMAKRQFGEDEGMVPPVLRDIYNATAKARSESLQGATPIERTLEMLQQQGFFHCPRINEDTNRVEALFFAHPRIAEIYKENPDIVVMDCTYKTNKFGLPLLCFVAITRVGIAIPVAHAFLHAENEAAYGWAFQCLKDMMRHYDIQEPSVALHDRDRALIHGFNRVFPGVHHLLCLWHMEADVKANVNLILEGEEQETEGGGHDSTSQGEAFLAQYHSVLHAKTVEAFDAAWNELKGKDAGEKWQRAAHYVESQWLKHHKELCVKAWTDSVRHYGTSTTSVVEGAHANLKGWLQTSHNDLLGFFEKMESFYDHQIDRYRNALARAQSHGVTPFINNPFYTRTIRVISTQGLKLVDLQRQKAVEDAKERVRNPQVEQPPCSHVFTRTMGLPCKHKLLAFIEDESSVMDHTVFDPHWIIPGARYALDRPRLLEPQIRRQRRLNHVDNHRRNQGMHGTAREPTLPERLDPNHPSTPPRTGAGGVIDSVRERRDAEPGRAVLPPNRPRRVKGCNCRKGCGTGSCPCKKERIRCTKDCHRGSQCSNDNAAAPPTQVQIDESVRRQIEERFGQQSQQAPTQPYSHQPQHQQSSAAPPLTHQQHHHQPFSATPYQPLSAPPPSTPQQQYHQPFSAAPPLTHQHQHQQPFSAAPLLTYQQQHHHPFSAAPLLTYSQSTAPIPPQQQQEQWQQHEQYYQQQRQEQYYYQQHHQYQQYADPSPPPPQPPSTTLLPQPYQPSFGQQHQDASLPQQHPQHTEPHQPEQTIEEQEQYERQQGFVRASHPARMHQKVFQPRYW